MKRCLEEKIKMAEQKRRQLRQKKEEALEAVEEKIKMKRAVDKRVLTRDARLVNCPTR